MGRLLPILVVLVAPCLAACGEPDDPGRRLRLASPLVERKTGADDRESVQIQARGPCRLVLWGEGLGGGTIRRELANRVLPAGRSVGLHWAVTVRKAPPESRGRPTEKDVEEGRTEAHEVIASYGFSDRGEEYVRTVVWTRPGLERTFHHSIPPPARPEPVPFDSVLELALTVVADLKSKDLKFATRGALTAVDFVDPLPRDKIQPVRLILQVERP